MGMLNGSYPAELADGLLARLRALPLVVTPAHHMAGSLERLGLEGAEVVWNPVDLTRFRPGPRDPALARRLGIGDGRLVVAHLSNFTALKRPLDVVAAAAIGLARDPRLLFLMVGDGSLRRATEQACEDAGIAESFRFVGWVDYEEVPGYLSLADIVVLPSAGEAQALVYLEAQATGRTLIASEIPAAREVVVDGETGLLFETGDVEALAELILLAAGDPRLREAIARKALERVQAHALPRTVARYEELLAGVAG